MGRKRKRRMHRPIRASYSQWGQDRWLLKHIFPEKLNGFFIEAEAADGLVLSNTLKFAERGWQGILIEPTANFNKLQRNRPESTCVNALRTRHDGEVVDFGIDHGDLAVSTRPEFRVPWFADRPLEVVKMAGVTLGTVLREHNAPKHIDLQPGRGRQRAGSAGGHTIRRDRNCLPEPADAAKIESWIFASPYGQRTTIKGW